MGLIAAFDVEKNELVATRNASACVNIFVDPGSQGRTLLCTHMGRRADLQTMELHAFDPLAGSDDPVDVRAVSSRRADRLVAAPSRLPRGYSVETIRRVDAPRTGRGDAEAATWIVHGDDVDVPRRRVAAGTRTV